MSKFGDNVSKAGAAVGLATTILSGAASVSSDSETANAGISNVAEINAEGYETTSGGSDSSSSDSSSSSDTSSSSGGSDDT